MTLKANALITQDELIDSMDLNRDEIRKACFRIYNGSGDATAATITVSANTLTLVVTGGVNAHNTAFDLTDAAYDTIGELLTAIEALAKGWVVNRKCSAAFTSADLYNIPATSVLTSQEELTLEGFNGLILDNLINAASEFAEQFTRRTLVSTAHTEYPDGGEAKYMKLKNFPIISITSLHSWDPVMQATIQAWTEHTDYEAEYSSGMLYSAGGWKSNRNDVKGWKIVYTAGYAAASMPEDLKEGVKQLCKYLYTIRQKQGYSSTSNGVLTTNYKKAEYKVMGIYLPLDLVAFLIPYRKRDF